MLVREYHVSVPPRYGFLCRRMSSQRTAAVHEVGLDGRNRAVLQEVFSAYRSGPHISSSMARTRAVLPRERPLGASPRSAQVFYSKIARGGRYHRAPSQRTAGSPVSSPSAVIARSAAINTSSFPTFRDIVDRLVSVPPRSA